MKYKFLGKPDDRFPNLKTGKVYELVISERNWGLMDVFTGTYHPQIVSPFMCPYSNWETFYKNWKSFVGMERFAWNS